MTPVHTLKGSAAVALAAALLAIATVGGAAADPQERTGSEMVRVTIIYDNYAAVAGVETDWGFSALIEHGGERILFDTGTQGRILLANADALGIDLSRIEQLVFSHIHQDHTGGMPEFYAGLAEGVRPTTWVIPSFPAGFKEQAGSRARVVELADWTEIVPGVWSTGEIRGVVNEQALVVTLPEGIVVITGCAHPGIVMMVERAKEHFDTEVLHVIGGFHLTGTPDEQVRAIIAAFRRLGVRKVTPTHCTGDRAIELFSEAYGADYAPGGIGRTITIGGTTR